MVSVLRCSKKIVWMFIPHHHIVFYVNFVVICYHDLGSYYDKYYYSNTTTYKVTDLKVAFLTSEQQQTLNKLLFFRRQSLNIFVDA